MKRFNSSTLSSGPAPAQAGFTQSDNVGSRKHGSVEEALCFPTASSLRYGNQSAHKNQPELLVTSTLGSGRNPLPFWKQTVDCVGCFVGLPLLAIGTVAWSVVAHYSSPGPVVYRQERVGYMGRRFWMYKFRTMGASAPHPTNGNSFVGVAPTDALIVKGKSRETAGQMPWARLLRAIAFDDLPQILNVWRGEMSFVGPRPYTSNQLEHSLRWQRERCDTLPGITGLAQVTPKKNLTRDDTTRLDIRYVRTGSLWLDAKILLRTVPHLLVRAREAARARRSSAGSTVSYARTSSSLSAPATTGQNSFN